LKENGKDFPKDLKKHLIEDPIKFLKGLEVEIIVLGLIFFIYYNII
jgi:hypothetical protein